MTRLMKGVLCILFPFTSLLTAAILFGMLHFFAVLVGTNSGPAIVFIMAINLFLGLFGLLGVLGIFIAIPVGVYLLITSDQKTSKSS